VIDHYKSTNKRAGLLIKFIYISTMVREHRGEERQKYLISLYLVKSLCSLWFSFDNTVRELGGQKM